MVGFGYTKPPTEVGRLNFPHVCRAEGSGGGREAGAERGVGGGGALLVAGPRGGGGGGRLAPILLVPNGGPANGLHPRFVVA